MRAAVITNMATSAKRAKCYVTMGRWPHLAWVALSLADLALPGVVD